QRAFPLDAFVQRMKAIQSEATITDVSAGVGTHYALPTTDDPRGLGHQQVSLSLTFATAAVGEFKDEVRLTTVKEPVEGADGDGDWKIAWTPDALFRDLAGERLVRLFTDKAQRGAIVDRHGQALAVQGGAITVGVVPGWIQDEGQALKALGEFLAVKPEVVKQQYASSRRDWYVPLKELPAARKAEAQQRLEGIAGVVIREKEVRSYPGGALAAHVLGYVSPVSADDLKTLAAKGYGEDDWVGRAGIEAWGEQQLAGQRGARLTIIGEDGQLIRTLAERHGEQGKSIQLTLDAGVQRVAEEALGDRVGSVVVLDPRDNSLLALASGPRFDPNGFVRGWTGSEWRQMQNNPLHPFQDRATLSAYATGSIFKPITMAAGMERAGLTPTTPFNCNGRWNVLPGRVFGDWKPFGHGALDLSAGLTQSCDIVFYEVSKKLDEADPNVLPQFARSFGLGAPTGIIGLEEAAGAVPDPAWKRQNRNEGWFTGDTVNLGIGQGFLEATPLQMANAYAALARGGSLKTPLLVSKVLDPRGAAVQQYEAQDKAALPVSAEHLAAIKAAMVNVAGSPEGTAYAAFKGFPTAVAAKTGAAENQDPESHAWFVGYAPAEAPQVVVLVMLERGGYGGIDAAPIARRVLEAALR
ncbi:MAG: penicillin-binding protein 2, partial [Chloroflexi bacterium]|nr:penicillin-binding protein 2 [Chloroflexota bacterium]